jgi:NAD(P)-dependent dehydrogenase (short-subunit alcohol dehydrogenase family)
MPKVVPLVVAGLAGVAAGRRLVRRRYDFRGRTVLVTGGSRGLGLLLAREFGRRGARVAICGRDAAALDRARHDLERRGVVAMAAPADVADYAQTVGMVEEVRRRLGGPDVLVNTAGVIHVGPLATMTLADFEEALGVNFRGAVHATLAALPELRRRRGRIVNIASIGGKIAIPHLVAYSASKFALVGFSAALHAELAREGIVVTTVCPGLMRTGSPRNATFKGRHRAEYAWFSIGDALPLVSMDADRAARQVVEACRRGDAEVTLGIPYKLAARIQGVAPGLTARVLGVVNRFLPDPGGIGTRRARGVESQSAASPSWLTALGDRAAVRNNEIA